MAALALHVLVARVRVRDVAAHAALGDVAERIGRVARLAQRGIAGAGFEGLPRLRMARVVPPSLEADVALAADGQLRVLIGVAEEAEGGRDRFVEQRPVLVDDLLARCERQTGREEHEKAGRAQRSNSHVSSDHRAVGRGRFSAVVVLAPRTCGPRPNDTVPISVHLRPPQCGNPRHDDGRIPTPLEAGPCCRRFAARLTRG